MITWYYSDAGLSKVTVDASAFDSFISVVAIMISIVAIIESSRIAIKQNRIALLEKRIEVLSAFERMVYTKMESWEWDGDCSDISHFSTGQLNCLFDGQFSGFHQELLDACKQINILNGDIDHAMTHGECRGETAEVIEGKREKLIIATTKKFETEKDRAYRKWISI